MIKRLKEILGEKYPDDYVQKTEVGRSFVALHRDSKVIDKLGDKGGTEGQFKADNVDVAEFPVADQTGFPGEDETNDYNLPTHYDQADGANGEGEYEFEDDDNDTDNDKNRSRKVQDEEVERVDEAGKKNVWRNQGNLQFKKFTTRSQVDNSATGDMLVVRKKTDPDKTWRQARNKGEIQSGSVQKDSPEYEKGSPIPSLGLVTHAPTYRIRRKPAQAAHDIKSYLNREEVEPQERQQSFLQHLDESPSRKDFQLMANTIRSIEDPKKRQEHADLTAAVYAQQNPRFDHGKYHAACGTKH